jgi:hypothetical protein
MWEDSNMTPLRGLISHEKQPKHKSSYPMCFFCHLHVKPANCSSSRQDAEHKQIDKPINTRCNAWNLTCSRIKIIDPRHAMWPPTSRWVYYHSPSRGEWYHPSLPKPSYCCENFNVLASVRIVCNIVLCKCEVDPTGNCVAKINLYSN